MADVNEIKDQLAGRIWVDHNEVLIAKHFILERVRAMDNHEATMMHSALRDFLEAMLVPKPDNVVIDDSVPLTPQLDAVAEHFRWRLAFAEAVWDLIHSGLLLIRKWTLFNVQLRQNYTISKHSAPSEIGEWNFSDMQVICPGHLWLAPSKRSNKQSVLADGDLYLDYLDLPMLPSPADDYLRQAVTCFRHELYLPAIVMLGSASEVVWSALGEILIDFADASSAPPTITQRIRKELTDPQESIAKKIASVIELFQQNGSGVFAPVAKASRVNLERLKSASIWAHCVRDARNALHSHGDTITATHETVSMFLLATRQNLGYLCALREAALNQLPNQHHAAIASPVAASLASGAATRGNS